MASAKTLVGTMRGSNVTRRRAAADYHTLEETRARLLEEVGSRAAMVRWVNIAVRRCGGDRDEAKDLIQDAVERIYSGGRRWPRDCEWNAFFHQTIRNIRSNQMRVRRHVIPFDDQLHSSHSDIESGEGVLIDADPDKLFSMYGGLVADDPQLQQYLKLRIQLQEKSQIKIEMNLTETEYDTLHRKLMRRLHLAHKNSRRSQT